MTAQLRMPGTQLAASIQDALARYNGSKDSPATTEADKAALLSAFRTWDEYNRRLLDRAFTPVSWRDPSPKAEYTTLQDLEFNTLLVQLPADRVSSLLS